MASASRTTALARVTPATRVSAKLVKGTAEPALAPSVHQLARQIYQTAPGEGDEKDQVAFRRLLHRIEADEALIMDAIAFYAGSAIRLQISIERAGKLKIANRPPKDDAGKHDAGLAARAALNVAALMRYRLPRSGIPLGKAKKEDLLAALTYTDNMRRHLDSRLRWFQSIYQAMKNDKLPVEKQLTEDDLLLLERRASQDALE